MTRKSAPKAGDRLRQSLLAARFDDGDEVWEFDARDLELIDQAAAIADRIAALTAAIDRDGEIVTGSSGVVRTHPGLVEERQQRLALRAVLVALQMPEYAEEDAQDSPTTAKARRAAQARWSRQKGRIGIGEAATR